jgi:hypothetical protein
MRPDHAATPTRRMLHAKLLAKKQNTHTSAYLANWRSVLEMLTRAIGPQDRNMRSWEPPRGRRVLFYFGLGQWWTAVGRNPDPVRLEGDPPPPTFWVNTPQTAYTEEQLMEAMDKVKAALSLVYGRAPDSGVFLKLIQNGARIGSLRTIAVPPFVSLTEPTLQALLRSAARRVNDTMYIVEGTPRYTISHGDSVLVTLYMRPADRTYIAVLHGAIFEGPIKTLRAIVQLAMGGAVATIKAEHTASEALGSIRSLSRGGWSIPDLADISDILHDIGGRRKGCAFFLYDRDLAALVYLVSILTRNAYGPSAAVTFDCTRLPARSSVLAFSPVTLAVDGALAPPPQEGTKIDVRLITKIVTI